MTTAAILLCLVAGIVGTSCQAIRARKAEKTAKEHLAAVQAAHDEAEQPRAAEAKQRSAAEENLKQAIAERRRSERMMNREREGSFSKKPKRYLLFRSKEDP